jgi:periplasmic copper chaperone A
MVEAFGERGGVSTAMGTAIVSEPTPRGRSSPLIFARHRRRLAVGAAALALLLAACAGTGTGAGPGAGSDGVFRAEGAWARPSMGMGRAGAAYVVLVNETGQMDALIGASSPAAAIVEIHESVETGGGMAMRPVDRIDVGAGGRTELKPGGYHVMLINLTDPLVAGDSIEITFDFERAPDLTVTAEVREN